MSPAQEVKFALAAYIQESWINFNGHKRGYRQETSLLQKGLNGWTVQAAKKRKETQRRPCSSLKQARKDAQDRKQLFQPLTAAVQAGQGTPGMRQQPSHHRGSRDKQPNSFLDQKGFICEEQQTRQGSRCSYAETPTPAKSSHSLETHHSSLAACFFLPAFGQGFTSKRAKALCKLARECLHGCGTCSTARERLGAGRGPPLPGAARTDPSVTAGVLGAAAPK